MPTKTFTVTLSPKTLKFIDAYRKERSLKSRSDVIEIALALLRESEHEAGISEAPEEEDLEGVDLNVPGMRNDDSH